MAYKHGFWKTEKASKGIKVDQRDRPRQIFQCVGRQTDGTRCPEKPLGSALYCKACGDKRAQAMKDSGSALGPGTKLALDSGLIPQGHGAQVTGPGSDTWTSGGGWTPGPSVNPLHGGAKLNRTGPYVACEHRGLDPVLTLSSGKQLYAAQGAKIPQGAGAAHLDLVLDCAGVYAGTVQKFVATSTNAKYRGLNRLAGPEIVRLQWPDMTAPVHVGIRFWRQLVTMLPDHTCVCCMGGHGRTGTALGALLVADGMDPDKAIAEVRTKHCQKAIETAQQETYIRKLAQERDSLEPRTERTGGSK